MEESLYDQVMKQLDRRMLGECLGTIIDWLNAS